MILAIHLVYLNEFA